MFIVPCGAYTLRCRARLTSNVRQRSAPLMREANFHRTRRANSQKLNGQHRSWPRQPQSAPGAAQKRGIGHGMASINQRRTRRSKTCKVTVHPSLRHLAGLNSASFTRRRATQAKFFLSASCCAAKAHCRAPVPASRYTWGFVPTPRALPNTSLNASPNSYARKARLGQNVHRPCRALRAPL